MKNSKLTMLLFFPFLFSSCALNYFYSYQPDKSITGKTIIVPTASTTATYVMVNDSIVLKNKYLKSFTLENLPDGKYKLQFSSYSNYYKEKLDEKFDIVIENGNQINKIVAVPPASNGYWIYTGLFSATLYALLFMNAYR